MGVISRSAGQHGHGCVWRAGLARRGGIVLVGGHDEEDQSREESCLPMRVSGRASWGLGGWKGVRQEEIGVENVLAEGTG